MTKRNSEAMAEVSRTERVGPWNCCAACRETRLDRIVRNSEVESAESVAAPPNPGVSRKVYLAFFAFEALVGELWDMPDGHAKNVAWERLLDMQDLFPPERSWQILPADSPPFTVRAGDEEEEVKE